MSKPKRPVLFEVTRKPHHKTKSEQRLHYRLLGRVYAILRDEDWQVRYCRLCDNPKLRRKLELEDEVIGTVDYETQIIYIDFRYDVLSTVVHECLHIIVTDRFGSGKAQYEAEEKEVRRLEKLMMEYMTRTQATRLHHLISARLMERKM